MPLNQLTYAQLQQQVAAAYSAQATIPANTAAGSSLGALINAYCLAMMQEQGEINYVAAVSRLATSVGVDCDTFVSPFGFARNAAVAAAGQVTFTAPSPAGVGGLSINVGTLVQTANGTQFQVVADTTNGAFNTTTNQYLIPQGQTQVGVTVNAMLPGSAGNVASNTITVITSQPGAPSPAGINACNNALALTNGADAETDAAMIARFALYMANKWATAGAVALAVSGVQAGLAYVVGDNVDQFGNSSPNYLSVVVNALGNGTAPGTALLNSVSSAVLANKAGGVVFGVFAPVLVTVNVTALTIKLAANQNAGVVQAACQTAFANYANNLSMGNAVATDAVTAAAITSTFSYARLNALLLGVTGVSSISGLTINGGVADITATYGQEIVAGTFTSVTQ